jgi:ribonuclease P protein component
VSAAPSGTSQGFPRADRLRRRPEFLRVQSRGRRVHTAHFVVMVMPAERLRLGVTVTRRTAGAVGRNRIKRLAREVFRRERGLFPPGCEVVLVARSGADQLDYATLRDELKSAHGALQRAGAGAPPPPKTQS